MSLKQQMKMPIHKDDLMPVISTGFFTALTGGIIIGAVHLMLLLYSPISLNWILLFIASTMMAKRIRQSYQIYHVLYAIIGIFFYVLTYYVMNITSYIGFYFIRGVTDVSFFGFLLNPLFYFQFLNPLSGFFMTVENLITVIFFLIGAVYTYRYIK